MGDDVPVTQSTSDAAAGAATSAEAAPSPEQVTALVHAAIPVTAHLGLEVLELRQGHVRLKMPFEPNRNHMGTMYAGSLVALAEIPGGLLPMTMPDLAVVPIAVGLDVRFLRGARGDAFLTAEFAPEELHRLANAAHRDGKAEFDLATEVHDADGVLLMTCDGHYQLRPMRT